jgi:hypothetical protein
MHVVELKELEGNDSFCINRQAMPQAIVFDLHETLATRTQAHRTHRINNKLNGKQMVSLKKTCFFSFYFPNQMFTRALLAFSAAPII